MKKTYPYYSASIVKLKRNHAKLFEMLLERLDDMALEKIIKERWAEKQKVIRVSLEVL